ncbi:MAG: hypothetical protein ACE1ZJ_04225, partial [Nitrospirales bacterium]
HADGGARRHGGGRAHYRHLRLLQLLLRIQGGRIRRRDRLTAAPLHNDKGPPIFQGMPGDAFFK